MVEGRPAKVAPLIWCEHLWRTNLKTTPLFQGLYAVLLAKQRRCFNPPTMAISPKICFRGVTHTRQICDPLCHPCEINMVIRG